MNHSQKNNAVAGVICAIALLVSPLVAWAQSADSTSYGSSTLNSGNVWDPNSAASALNASVSNIQSTVSTGTSYANTAIAAASTTRGQAIGMEYSVNCGCATNFYNVYPGLCSATQYGGAGTNSSCPANAPYWYPLGQYIYQPTSGGSSH